MITIDSYVINSGSVLQINLPKVKDFSQPMVNKVTCRYQWALKFVPNNDKKEVKLVHLQAWATVRNKREETAPL